MQENSDITEGLSFEEVVFSKARTAALSLGPFAFELDNIPSDLDVDGALRCRLDGASLERLFAFEAKTTWTRKSRREASERLRQLPEGLRPLLVGHYFSNKVLEDFRALNLSALDLSGNGLLIDLPHLFVLCTGARKKKTHYSSPPRLAIYDSSNVSTLVPRIILTQREFPSVKAILQACHDHMEPLTGTPKPLTLPTVSKALRVLDEDLITDRRGRKRFLVDRTRLLQNLKRGLRPSQGTPLMLKTALDEREIWTKLSSVRGDVRYVQSGLGSAARYTSLVKSKRIQLYASNALLVKDALEAKVSRAFPNVEVTQESSESAYFDISWDKGIPWASTLQCYLELASPAASPRERGAAEQLRQRLLEPTPT